ncbi:MAG: VWA domain-containing protein, partial [Planctomycetota bacterium]
MLLAGELEWRDPMWFALAAAAAVLVVVMRLRLRPRAAMATAPLPAREIRMPITWRTILARLPLLGEALAVLLFGAALARPVHVEHDPPLRLGRDVLLCLDRSSSMAATDLAGDVARDLVRNGASGAREGRPQTRLDVARAVGAEFLRRRVDDRVGLVAFSRFADLVCAPTVDREAAAERLASVALADADGPEDATAIGAAVGLCADLLQRRPASSSAAASAAAAAQPASNVDGESRTATNSRVIVLLTDGEENVATTGGADAAGSDEIAPLHAGQWCREL